MNYLHYDFVQHALLAGSLAAILGAIVGYFVVIRNVGFAVHALAHIGFTGATGASLLMLSPLEGMLAISVLAAMMMGVAGNKLNRSDVAIGMVLSLALGIGTLFLALYKGFAGETTAILFGNIFGVSHEQIIQTFFLSMITLGILAIFSRRLLFASVQPDLAEAHGISLSWLSVVFMILVAVSVTLASQVVGILLVFSLVIGPASIATRLCRNFWSGLSISIIIALGTVWSGILLACLTNWPPSFWITGILFSLYVVTEIVLKVFR
ncbi:MAG: metal ABC transporter permease [Chthoniobacterales bacterium]